VNPQGMPNDYNPAMLEKVYPKIELFIQQYQNLNPLRLFDNPRTKLAGFGDLVQKYSKQL